MKLKVFFLSLICSLYYSSLTFGQKYIKTMADEVCDCIKDIKDEYPDADPKTLLGKCFGPSMQKHQKEIKKKLGVDVFESKDKRGIYNLGVEVGKVLATNCPDYLDLFYNQQTSKNSAAIDYYNKAQELYDKGAFDAAIENYNKALKAEPDNYQFLNSRGVAYFGKENYYLAIADFMAAARSKPDFSRAWHNSAYAKFHLGDYDNALSEVKKAIRLDTMYCDSKNLLGLVYNKLEYQDSALLAFSKAYVCDTTNAQYAFNVAYLLYEKGMNKTALTFFNKALNMGYQDLNVYNYIGNCNNEIGEYDKAIDAFSFYIDQKDDDYVGFYNRGLAYYNKENYAQAIQEFEQAAQRDSTDSDIYYQQALCYTKDGNYQKAEVFFNQAISMNADQASYFDGRAGLYDKMGQYEKAIDDSKVSLGLYPDDCHIYQLISDWYDKLNLQKKASEFHEKALQAGCKE